MKILAIETSCDIGSIALLEDENVIKEKFLKKVMVHGRELVPAMQSILSKSKISFRDIDMIAVDVGPGSYTGLRVGLATAKGFAYALKKDIVGVRSLDAIAENITAKNISFISPVVDARWQQVFSAIYKADGGKKEVVIEPAARSPTEFAKMIPPKSVLLGNALASYKNVFAVGKWKISDKRNWFPRASKIGLLGYERYKNGEKDDVFKIIPLYLRLTEAEVKFGRHSS